MESKHTKGIWKVNESSEGVFQIDSDKNTSAYAIATVIQGKIFPSKRTKQEAQYNAEFICTAVNAHDELVKALDTILNQGRVNNNYADTCSKMKTIAANALKKVTDTSPVKL